MQRPHEHDEPGDEQNERGFKKRRYRGDDRSGVRALPCLEAELSEEHVVYRWLGRCVPFEVLAAPLLGEDTKQGGTEAEY